MNAITLNLTLSFNLPPDVKSGRMEVIEVSESRKELVSGKSESKKSYPVLKIDETEFAIVNTATDDGRSVWPTEDYFEGDDVYDDLYPRN